MVLVARLAVDRTEQGNDIGGHVLVEALRRCVRGGREFGARAVIVDAIDDPAAAFTATSTPIVSTTAAYGAACRTSRA